MHMHRDEPDVEWKYWEPLIFLSAEQYFYLYFAWRCDRYLVEFGGVSVFEPSQLSNVWL